MIEIRQKITPFLWFENQAEEAVNFYTSIFSNSKILNVSRYGAQMPLAEGTVMTITFELDGNQFTALNGGPEYKFNEAISFLISCKDQDEVDFYWNKLTEGGEEIQCGWLKDKYGLSWQVVPVQMYDYIGGKDSQGAFRAVQEMFKMKKLDLDIFKKAYEGNL